MTNRKPPPNKGKSAALDWLRAHINFDGPDCLIWPFGTSRGYAQVGMDRKIKKASRVMCEWVNGPPPTPKHEAAHSCGRGHEACVHPKHLSWKTRSENQQDRRKHGTHGRGKYLRAAYRLTPIDVAEIRRIGGSVSKEELGRRFGVTPSNIAKVLKGESWPNGGYTPRGWAVTPYRGGSRRKVSGVGEHTSGGKDADG